MILEMVINASPFGEEYFHASRLMCVVISASLLPRRQSVRKNAGAVRGIARPPTAVSHPPAAEILLFYARLL